MKKLFLLVVGVFLFACSNDSDSSPDLVTRDMAVILDAQKDFCEDSVIYLADSANYIEELDHKAYFNDGQYSGLHYYAGARSASIQIYFDVIPNSDGGSIMVACHPKASPSREDTTFKIVFEHPVFPVEKDGYSLSFMDSLKVGDSTFYDVVQFKNSTTFYNDCKLFAFYFGIHDGLVKVVSRNGAEMNRVSDKVYKDIVKRREEERAREDSIAQAVADSIAQAVADSIAQAVADSIAQAVADSIIKANTPAVADSSDEDSSQIEIPQEVLDLADSVAECLKKAYSSGSISAIKDCQI